MARSAAQSDFSVERPVEVTMPATAHAVALPDAAAIGAQAGELTSRWVLRATWLMLLALAVLCLVGPHIPSGE
jgi:D-tyrosyl-tRNA(Tyr) deacylase